MLFCCSRHFMPEKKIVLPPENKLYRCLEFGYCPHCKIAVSRLIEQTKDYNTLVTQKTRGRALRALERALVERIHFVEKIRYGTKSNEHYYFGDYRRTRRRDTRNNTIYEQLKRNFNGKTEILGEVTTIYS